MDNYSYIRENYKKTIISLKRGLEECASNPSDLMIDGLIQRFEFACDLALKACSNYLDTAGHRIEGKPKTVLQKAHNIGLIEDLNVWNAIVTDRAATLQIYDKNTARRIATNLQNEYMTSFQALAKKFS